MQIFRFFRDHDKDSKSGSDNSHKSDKGEQIRFNRDINKSERSHPMGRLEESRLPDFEHTPPTPSTPPPPTVDKAGSEGGSE